MMRAVLLVCDCLRCSLKLVGRREIYGPLAAVGIYSEKTLLSSEK